MNSPKSAACQPKPINGFVKVNADLPLATPPATVDETDPYVQLTVQVRRSTYLGLKQAEYWMPGFGEMRQHVDKVLKNYISTLPGSNQPLPKEVLAKSKKLKI